MKFSTKAYKYFGKLYRDDDYILPYKNELIKYFSEQNVPVFEKVVDFQMEYSGLVLTIFKKPFSSFKAILFSNSDIKTKTSIDFLKINGQYYFYCGDHETAQFWFVLSQSGEICTYDNNKETINVIFSSFEKFIETYALEDSLAKNEIYEDLSYYTATSQTLCIVHYHMTDHELKVIIAKLRQSTLSERQKNPTREIDIFFINVLEIACSLTELGLSQKRQIKREEQYWFEGAYHMNFWDAAIEGDLYGPLVTEVAKRNWFR